MFEQWLLNKMPTTPVFKIRSYYTSLCAGGRFGETSGGGGALRGNSPQLAIPVWVPTKGYPTRGYSP